MIRVPVVYNGDMSRRVGYLEIDEEVAELMVDFPNHLSFSVTTSSTYGSVKEQLIHFNISPTPAEPKEYREKLERIQGN